jgi:hypothetical protein
MLHRLASAQVFPRSHGKFRMKVKKSSGSYTAPHEGAEKRQACQVVTARNPAGWIDGVVLTHEIGAGP